MNSVRLKPELREKLRRVAEKKGVRLSDVHREALERYCADELAEPQHSRYDDVIGVCEGAPADLSANIGPRFADAMARKYGV